MTTETVLEQCGSSNEVVIGNRKLTGIPINSLSKKMCTYYNFYVGNDTTKIDTGYYRAL